MSPATLHRLAEYGTPSASGPQARTNATFIGQGLFRGVLLRERKRADRSNQPLLLVVVELEGLPVSESAPMWPTVVAAVASAKRETDVLGWFEEHRAVGLVVPDLPEATPDFASQVHDRIRRELARRLDDRTARRVSLRLHMHPDPKAMGPDPIHPIDPIVNGQMRATTRQAVFEAAKRVLDAVCSLVMLAVLSPVFLAIAALVKLTSPGPVFFKQERVGQMMKPFMMRKFRTMRVDADHAIHHQFVSAFIQSGKAGAQAADVAQDGLFKIVNDPRVTMVGRILRKTSLDELPQLWNVLVGEMSLVGPRPPLRYEVEQYQSWHKRRVLEAKPGLTGLWQVTGRSRTTFDEMVRLDLRYARSASVWTDIKILAATPGAVIGGKGAC